MSRMSAGRELRQRQVIVDEVLSVLVDAVGRNDVRDIALRIAEGLSCHRIVDDRRRPNGYAIADQRREQRGEIAIAEGLRIPEGLLHGLLSLARPFVIETPERSVLAFIAGQQNRPRQPSSELVAAQPVLRLQRRSGRNLEVQEVILRIGSIVAQKFEKCAMEIVRSGFQAPPARWRRCSCRTLRSKNRCGLSLLRSRRWKD